VRVADINVITPRHQRRRGKWWYANTTTDKQKRAKDSNSHISLFSDVVLQNKTK